MKKILIVFGTRPEAIKMCPLINAFKTSGLYDVKVCSTGQHKEMLEVVLKTFNVKPDYELDVMKEKQDLFYLTTSIMNGIKKYYKKKNLIWYWFMEI